MKSKRKPKIETKWNRLMMRQAVEIQETVRNQVQDRPHKEREGILNWISQSSGMPKTLVRNLATGNDGYLFDCFEWVKENVDE